MRKLFAGDRRVWAVGGGTLGALLIGVLIALALPSDGYYTGTNSIAVQSIVKVVPSGKALCVPDLYVPAGTGRMRFAAFWPRNQQRAFRARLDGNGGLLFRRGGLQLPSDPRDGGEGAPRDDQLR